MKRRGRPGDRARAGGAPAGLRERNKERKLEAIVRAGRTLFVQKGFEQTTTRAIAAKAGVAAGTFFLYFGEKRELLFHLFRDEVSSVQEEAFASLPRDAPLPEQLAHVFGSFYAYYARDPRLSRVFMKELLFLERGESDDVMALTGTFVERIAGLVGAARARGELEAAADPARLAEHVFALYVFGVIGYLNSALPTPESARALLARQLETVMRGVARGRRRTARRG